MTSYLNAKATKEPVLPCIQALRDLPNAGEVATLLRACWRDIGAVDPNLSEACYRLAAIMRVE